MTQSATQTAQPTCSDGMAAYWLLRPSIPRGALAASPHQPTSAKAAMVSVLDGGLVDVAVLHDRVELLAVERGQDLRRRLHRWLDHWPGAG